MLRLVIQLCQAICCCSSQLRRDDELPHRRQDTQYCGGSLGLSYNLLMLKRIVVLKGECRDETKPKDASIWRSIRAIFLSLFNIVHRAKGSVST